MFIWLNIIQHLVNDFFPNLLLDFEWRFLFAAVDIRRAVAVVGPVAEAGGQFEELGLLAVNLRALDNRVEARLFPHDIWNKKYMSKLTKFYDIL